ncbi:MAG: DUF2299 domain-containing protein [Methanobacteriaceae archaeon]
MIDSKEIQLWLADEGLFKEKNHNDNANFHFIVNYPDGNLMDIVQPKGKEDMLVIGCATSIGPEHREIIKNTTDKKKVKLIWDFRFALNSFLLDFELDHPNNEIAGFVITDEIFEDGLTKDRLMSNIKKVFKGKLQCLWILAQNFDEEEIVSDENSMFV